MDVVSGVSSRRVGILAGVMLVAALAAAAWVYMRDEPGDGETPDGLVAAAALTLTARAPVVPTPEPTSLATSIAPSTSTQAGDVVCEVDLPAANVAASVPRNDPTYTNWYGDAGAGLWASPSDPAGLLPAPMPEPSSIWFSGVTTYLMWHGTGTPLRVTAERLDGDGALGPLEPINRFDQVQITALDFPTPGCWRVTGENDDASMTLTVEVLPAGQRVDFIYLRQLYDARPYPIPASCSPTPLNGPEERRNYNIAHYWLDGESIQASVFEWPVAGQQLALGVFGTGVADSLSAVARKLDPRVEEQFEASVSAWNEGQLARFTFPSAGCWELELASPLASATFVLYVYPTECLPDYNDGEILVACEPPRS